MKKDWAGVLAAMLLAAVLALSGCALAEETVPEATEQPRPAAETLTELKNALTPAEEPSFQNFQAITLTGDTVNQEIFAGHKVTMINIWATFCNPCISEMPGLAQLNQAYEEGEFQVIGLVVDMLDTDGSLHPMAVETAWTIVDATGADYMHLLPTDDLIAAKLQYVYSVPETIFVDSEGNILTPDEEYVGARDYEAWKAIADGILASLTEE